MIDDNGDDDNDDVQHTRMNMTELASTCRNLHALQAKQLLHLESTLVAEYGYITASQREENEEESNGFISEYDGDAGMDGTEGEYKDGNMDCCDSHNLHHDLETENGNENVGVHPATPSWLRNPTPSDYFQPTPSLMDRRLSRLSEATLETDVGTPGSVFTVKSNLSPNEVVGNANENGSGSGNGTGSGNRRASMMSLKSLAEEESENELESEHDDSEGERHASDTVEDCRKLVNDQGNNVGTENDNINSATEQESSTPKTPSIADVKFRYVRLQETLHIMIV